MTNEFLQMLCNFYIVVIAAILPLYTRGTYVMLGDDKYVLFRGVSLLCLGLWTVAVLAKKLARLPSTLHSFDKHALSKQLARLPSTLHSFDKHALSKQLVRLPSVLHSFDRHALPKRLTRLSNTLYSFFRHGSLKEHVSLVWESLKALFRKRGVSSVDFWVMLYGIAVVVSAMCSSYGVTAWAGYADWHMGAVSQLIFVGAYFFVSRCYRGDVWPVFLMVAAFFLVIVLGVCSRLGLDPLGLMQEFDSGYWEFSHLISTIGNINWFCGYCAVALAMPVAGYMKGKSLWETFMLYVVSALGLLLLCIQGSDIGPVLVIVCLGVCLLWSRGRAEEFGRTLLLAAGTAFGLPCYSGIVRLCGEEALKSLPADGPGLQLFGWGGWWLAGIICIGLYIFLRRLTRRAVLGRMGLQKMGPQKIGLLKIGPQKMGPQKKETFEKSNRIGSRNSMYECVAIVRGLWLGMVVLGAAVIIVGGILYLWRLSESWAWQNGRGALWRLALQGFWRGDWKQKLLGAGPDCFAEYIYSAFAPSELFVPEDHWANAIFANAHNQWLNHLVNIGLLGTSCVAGAAIAAVRRYYRYLPGVLVVTLYGVNSLVSFQQVMNTPLFFIVLGLCEYYMRNRINTK